MRFSLFNPFPTLVLLDRTSFFGAVLTAPVALWPPRAGAKRPGAGYGFSLHPRGPQASLQSRRSARALALAVMVVWGLSSTDERAMTV